MEPVVGVDVSKGSSIVQGFVGRNEPYGKLESISHEESGFERLGELLDELKVLSGMEPVVILEATGHYHRGVVAYLMRGEYKHFVINPLQSKRARSTQLRKVKTDAADAWHLADMYYRGDVTPHRTWDELYTELQHVTRQHEFITSMYVQAKLNSRALLDQVFPAFEKVFSNSFSTTALKVLKCCLSDRAEEIEAIIQEQAGKSHSKEWIEEKTDQLRQAMLEWSNTKRSKSQSLALEEMVSLLLEFQNQLSRLEKHMEEISATLPEVELLKTIPGIGDKLAATIIAEIGDARQFTSAKQLVAYAGLDTGVYSSGKFTATSNRIMKRGSKRLRRALYLAVQCGLRRGINSRIKHYYDKKRKEGKSYKVVVIACANKLLHHIYSILNKDQPYQV
ncbi:IS110 family transposase [Brevibacillus fluminis]|uniref:IS110 family transposase n=1 Tax=Brevibacillus fluminis TaxID=511487 RepID=A0A3M8CXY6_9BACL|nr:IS110 family transposase [Brevibacillus fluminis]RNB79735.1 IS110 family transposase [Brevibacillus fluminis]